MNQGQKQFYDFIVERVRPDKAEEAKALLEENFKKQAEGRFTKDDIANFAPKITAMLQPEKIEEVHAAMRHFGDSFGR